VAQFWQMIWEQGIGLLVNLCDSQESTVGEYAKYWPEEGSKVFGKFEAITYK
jgi:protein tyrosine phosphatase